MLEVRLLGQFDVRLDGRPIEIASRPAQSLLAYLILNPGTAHRREKLAGLLWPDTAEANARRNLRQALWHVRKTLEPAGRDYFLADDISIAFDANSDYWLDVSVLDRKTAADWSPEDLIGVVSVYGGDLLPGFYDEWATLERERLQAVFEYKMKLLLDRLVEARRWEDALEWGERWIALGHVPEPAYRALILAHAGMGDLSKMAATYRRCVEALRKELGVEPSEQTRALHERLARGESVPGLSTGATFSTRYRVEGELGRGGMGVVYRAQDTLLDRAVAVKVLNNASLGTDGRARLLREAQAAAKLNHPNIVSIHDAGENEGVPFIVMELVEGESLRNRRPQSVDEILAIARQVCAALEHVHAHGIVHRDFKPENITLTSGPSPSKGEGGRGVRVKLMDFGLARSTASRLTEEGALVGTVFYLAPEQALGEAIDGRADLYSLGVVLYELVAGRLPFTGDDPLAVISQHLHAPVVPPSTHNPDIPPALDALIVQLLSKRPDDRPTSAAEVQRALDDVAGTLSVGTAVELLSQLEPSQPSPLDRLARGRLVGRERELAQAKALWQQVVSAPGDEYVLLVSGEPGVGKTRFVRELTTLAEVTGGAALIGECYAEGGAPYAPLAQIIDLTGLVDLSGLTPLVLADLLTLAPSLRARFPDVPPNPPLDPQAEQLRLFESVVALFAALAAHAPVVLVVDDAHWADGGTLALLRHLARRARQLKLRLLIALTYREVELDEARALNDVLRDLNRERLETRLKLARLDKEHTRDMLAVLFQEDITPEFLDGIYRETEGNPFFVEEVCKALIEDGKLYREGGRWRRPGMEAISVPQSVRVAIQARVGRLPAPAQDALRLAAVIGREFEFEVLRQVGELDEEALLDALERAERAQLIREVSVVRFVGTAVPRSVPSHRQNSVGTTVELLSHRPAVRETLAFAHALIPSTLRESVSGLRRHRLHRRVAVVIEDLRPDNFEALAYHYGQAGDEEHARAYAIRAGDRARKLYANEDAIRFYSEALALMPDDHPDRFDLLASRAGVYDVVARRQEQRADAEAMLALAEKQNDDARRFEALIALADYYLETEYIRAREPAERAAAIARALGDPVREGHALRRLGQGDYSRRDLLRSRSTLEAAAARFQQAGQPGEAATCLHMLALTSLNMDDIPAGQRAAEEAIALSRAAGDRRQEAHSLRRLGLAYFKQNRQAENFAVTEAALALHREVGDRFGEMSALNNLGWSLGGLGRTAEAEAPLRQSLEIAYATGSSSGTFNATGGLTWTYYQPQGQHEAGLAFLEEQFAKVRLTGDELLVNRIQLLQAVLLAQLGQFAQAAQLAQTYLSIAERLLGQSEQVWVLSFIGRWQAELGQFAQSQQSLTAALQLAETTDVPLDAAISMTDVAYAALLEGDLAGLRAGLEQVKRAVHLYPDYWTYEFFLAYTLDVEAQLRLALGEVDEAVTCSTKVMQLMDTYPTIWWSERYHFTHPRALRVAGREAEANDFLRRAYERVMLVAEKTHDETLRRSWLENVRANREILAEWRARGMG